MPVIIHGTEAGQVTRDGSGTQEFRSLTEALAAFPDLDTARNTPRFSRAMLVDHDDVLALRFSTWEAVRRACSESGEVPRRRQLQQQPE